MTTDDSSAASAVESADHPTFAAPWQARVFALAVALTDEDDRDRTWAAFQEELVAEIETADQPSELPDPPSERATTESSYYRAWLAALERFLTDRAVIDADSFSDRAAAFAAGDRDAHEFVTGDPRAHTDRLPEGHADGGHHHDHAGDKQDHDHAGDEHDHDHADGEHDHADGEHHDHIGDEHDHADGEQHHDGEHDHAHDH